MWISFLLWNHILHVASICRDASIHGAHQLIDIGNDSIHRVKCSCEEELHVSSFSASGALGSQANPCTCGVAIQISASRWWLQGDEHSTCTQM